MVDPRPSTLKDGLIHGPVQVGAGSAVLLRGNLEEGEAKGPLQLEVGAVATGAVQTGVSRSAGPGRLLWWSLVPLPAGTEAGVVPIALRAGGIERHLGELEIATTAITPTAAPTAPPPPDQPMVAVCMATFEPSPRWFRRQIESIRGQDWNRWICLISDDGSSPESVAMIEEEIAGDERFVLAGSPVNTGFYANFERALRMVPGEAELIALSDQDDRWYPDKLRSLAAALEATPGALLAYSDMRIVNEREEVISETFWYQSANSYEDIATMAIVNTVTGGAALFRRELLEVALPFPPAFSDQHYHDHWLALCALALGELAYVDRPTYDYTRHTGSITLSASRQWTAPLSGLRERAIHRFRVLTRRLRLATSAGALPGAYFDRYLMLRQYIQVLRLRVWGGIDPAKRSALERIDQAEGSPRAAAWLLVRSFRPILGHTETLGRERVLLSGLLWRRTATLRSRMRRAARRRTI